MSLIEWVDFPNLGDSRGSLIVLESNKNIPFEVKRMYYIFDSKMDTPRGFHAHHQLTQIAICLKGSFKMLMDDGNKKEEAVLDRPDRGLVIPPMVWHEMHNISEDCIMLVLADDYYNESDYIRDYDEFQKLKGFNDGI